MTCAPAACARATVASRLPPSATMTRSTGGRGMPWTTCAIDCSSSSVGMTTVMRPAAAASTVPSLLRRAASIMLEAPAQAAVRTSVGRPVGQQRLPERAVGCAVPDLLQRLLGGVAQRVVLVAALRERSDAAWQRPAVGGEIHHRPGSPAQRPGRAAIVAFEAHARLCYHTGGAEDDAVGARKLGGRVEMGFVRVRHVLVEGLVGPRVTDGIAFEKHQALQIDLAHADIRRHAHEGRQLRNRLLQSREPGRDSGTIFAFAFLQIAEGADVLEDAAEIILAANSQKGLRIRRVERDAKLVESGLDQCAAVPLVENGAVGVK